MEAMEVDYWTRCGLDGGNCSCYVDISDEEYAKLLNFAKEHKAETGEEMDGSTLTEFLENNMPDTYNRVFGEVEDRVYEDMSQWDEYDESEEEAEEDYDEDERYERHRQRILDQYSYGFNISDDWASALSEDEED